MRIGIRHREQQTLYISELIDTQSEDLAHGRLWLGLHITAIYDALERLPLLIQAKSIVARPLKRERVDSDIDPVDIVKKRARLRRKKEEVRRPYPKESRC